MNNIIVSNPVPNRNYFQEEFLEHIQPTTAKFQVPNISWYGDPRRSWEEQKMMMEISRKMNEDFVEEQRRLHQERMTNMMKGIQEL